MVNSTLFFYTRNKRGNKMKNHGRIMDVFNNAAFVTLEFHGHQYRGAVADIRAGEYLNFKVENIDDGLVRVPIGYDFILLRVFTIQGKLVVYRTQLKMKKIPLLLLDFPEHEVKTFIRIHNRYDVNMNTPIALTRRVNGLLFGNINGLGTITNVSQGGCAINTALRLEKEDTIKCFLDLSNSEGGMSVALKGDVKRVGKTAGRTVNYGVQFADMTPPVSGRIKEFIKRFSSKTAVTVAGSMAGNAESS